jgi:hypothetical protein
MERAILVTDETPHCVWGWNLAELERQFLDGIDPEYFSYMAEIHLAQIDGGESRRAALALRMTYSHALETLMSLVGALIQAPTCVIGWLHKYSNEELKSVISKVHHSQPLLTGWNLKKFTWADLSNVVHRHLVIDDKNEMEQVKRDFGVFWSRIASEFLDDDGRQEYNSIKHGLRARSGGFSLAAGLEAQPGIPCPPDQMKPLGGSRFGSTFYCANRIDGVEKCNIKITSASRNWLPKMLANRISVISLSMKNILSFLKLVNSTDATPQEFAWDLPSFETCWSASVGVLSMSFETPLEAQDIQPLSKKEILDLYQQISDDGPS